MPILRRVRYSLAKTPARAPLVWRRHKGFGANDAFLASYPRSGSTWLRFQLLEILAGHLSEFSAVNDMLPDVGRHKHAPPLLPGAGRLIKTHEPFRREYSQKKAVYLVRDVRDVIFSEYAYHTALDLAGKDFDEYLDQFLQGKVNPFGSWVNHVQTWMGAADAGRVKLLVIQFEKMRRCPEETLVQILAFLDFPVARDKIAKAVANNSLERMRAKEKITPQRASAKGQFVRSGSIGGWAERLTSSQLERIDQCAARALARIGYSASGSIKVPV